MQHKKDPSAEEEILDLSRKLVEAERNKDLAATLAFFGEGIVLQPPGAPQIEGLDALQGFLVALFQTPMENFDAGASKIIVSVAGDLACEIGWFRMPVEGPQGHFDEHGKYTIVWQKIAGEWKYIVGCFNANEAEE